MRIKISYARCAPQRKRVRAETYPETDLGVHSARDETAAVWQPCEGTDRIVMSRKRGDTDAGLRGGEIVNKNDGKRADFPGRRLTSVFHILMIASAAVSKMESSGDHAMHETGSACSRKIFSSVKPDCV